MLAAGVECTSATLRPHRRSDLSFQKGTFWFQVLGPGCQGQPCRHSPPPRAAGSASSSARRLLPAHTASGCQQAQAARGKIAPKGTVNGRLMCIPSALPLPEGSAAPPLPEGSAAPPPPGWPRPLVPQKAEAGQCPLWGEVGGPLLHERVVLCVFSEVIRLVVNRF